MCLTGEEDESPAVFSMASHWGNHCSVVSVVVHELHKNASLTSGRSAVIWRSGSETVKNRSSLGFLRELEDIAVQGDGSLH